MAKRTTKKTTLAWAGRRRRRRGARKATGTAKTKTKTTGSTLAKRRTKTKMSTTIRRTARGCLGAEKRDANRGVHDARWATMCAAVVAAVSAAQPKKLGYERERESCARRRRGREHAKPDGETPRPERRRSTPPVRVLGLGNTGVSVVKTRVMAQSHGGSLRCFNGLNPTQTRGGGGGGGGAGPRNLCAKHA